MRAGIALVAGAMAVGAGAQATAAPVPGAGGAPVAGVLAAGGAGDLAAVGWTVRAPAGRRASVALWPARAAAPRRPVILGPGSLEALAVGADGVAVAITRPRAGRAPTAHRRTAGRWRAVTLPPGAAPGRVRALTRAGGADIALLVAPRAGGALALLARRAGAGPWRVMPGALPVPVRPARVVARLTGAGTAVVAWTTPAGLTLVRRTPGAPWGDPEVAAVPGARGIADLSADLPGVAALVDTTGPGTPATLVVDRPATPPLVVPAAADATPEQVRRVALMPDGRVAVAGLRPRAVSPIEDTVEPVVRRYEPVPGAWTAPVAIPVPFPATDLTGLAVELRGRIHVAWAHLGSPLGDDPDPLDPEGSRVVQVAAVAFDGTVGPRAPVGEALDAAGTVVAGERRAVVAIGPPAFAPRGGPQVGLSR